MTWWAKPNSKIVVLTALNEKCEARWVRTFNEVSTSLKSHYAENSLEDESSEILFRFPNLPQEFLMFQGVYGLQLLHKKGFAVLVFE
jgi:hypothetical protein